MTLHDRLIELFLSSLEAETLRLEESTGESSPTLHSTCANTIAECAEEATRRFRRDHVIPKDKIQ